MDPIFNYLVDKIRNLDAFTLVGESIPLGYMLNLMTLEVGAQAVLSLRALSHTDSRWDQFWEKLNQYGYSLAA